MYLLFFYSTNFEMMNVYSVQFSSVQSLSHVQLFATPWITARQASLSITNSQGLLKLKTIKSVIPSNHLILCRFLLLPSIFPSIRVFSNESVLRIRWPSIAVSASASVLPMNVQDWFPLGSPCSPRDSRCALNRSYISRMTIYSLDILLSQFCRDSLKSQIFL